MKLSPYLKPELTWMLGPCDGRDELFSQLSHQVTAVIPLIDHSRFLQAMLKRESIGSTATPEGVAFPHAMLHDLKESQVAVALVKDGVVFPGKHPYLVRLVLLLLGPANAPWEHLRILARAARLISNPDTLQRLLGATTAAMLHKRLMEEDHRHA